MKTIGLIGGMSWESSAEYYRIINEEMQRRLQGVNSAKSLMTSVNFAEIEALQHKGEWEKLGDIMAENARALEKGGADFIVLCTNTMHKLSPAIESAVSIPLLHIADPTAQKLKAQNIRRVGLLGTAFTMEQDFYKKRLIDLYGLDVLIPDDEGRKIVHRIIYEELVIGVVKDESRALYRDVIASLVERGAEGIILGCTEIMLLIGEKDAPVPVFDTTTLHALAAVDMALS